jgi:hypothetical protein
MSEKKEEKKPFLVRGFAIPMRVRDSKKNQKNWEAMTKGIEDQLNSMQKDGYAVQIHFDFVDHGCILIGHSMKVLNTPFGMVMAPDLPDAPSSGQVLGRASEAAPSDTSTKAIPIFNAILARLRAESATTEATIEPVVKKVLATADVETVRKLGDLIDRFMHGHVEHGPCDSNDMFKVMRRAITTHLLHNVS